MEKMQFTDLDPVSGIAQCLDDQWAPEDVLEKSLSNNVSPKSYKDEINKRARAEFVKSLLVFRTTIINRTFFWNNDVISRLYVGKSKERDSFQELLDSKAIVPFLYNEENIEQKPTAIDVHPEVFDDWISVCRNVNVTALRLSWDNGINARTIEDVLAGRFSGFARLMDRLDPHALMQSLKIERNEENYGALKALLKKIASESSFHEINEEKKITRRQIYQKYIVKDGTLPEHGFIDASKPFAASLKKIFDLKYNVNLPDALNRYALTPQDAISRSALGELDVLVDDAKVFSHSDIAELMTVMGNLALGDGLRRVSTSGLDRLYLAQILNVRSSEIWGLHQDILRENLADSSKPMLEQSFMRDPAQAIDRISHSYANVVAYAGRLADADHRKEVEQSVELWLHVVGLAVKVVVQVGTGLSIFIPPDVKSLMKAGLKPFLVELVVKYKGEGIDYEMKQPILQGAVNGEMVVDQLLAAREKFARSRPRVERVEYTEGGGIEMKDKDEAV